ncbi:DedA family protein [Sphingomonas ginkgonis]|uniref:DedA family protein n=1 Tax=Sphingomonas ginkgonis TaxID=2315330 RepID=UPI001EF14AE8|nr:DedA family protein [Sphingomonas ginkgonis]
MNSWIDQGLAFIASHGAWAGPLVGLLTFGESLAIIGMFIPATAAMLAVGGLMATGAVDPVSVIGFAALGAALGDWVSYELGRRIGPRAYRFPFVKRHRTGIAMTRLLFRRYGFLSIIFGRFLGPIRATVPLVAGVLEMKRRTFQIANWGSAIFWVLALFLPGYVGIKTLAAFEEEIDGLMLWVGIGAVVVSLVAVAAIAKWIGSGGGAGRRRRERRLAAAQRQAG